MSYHLIEQPSYFHREAPCGPDCAGPGRCMAAPREEHRQDYALGLCGREVVRYVDQYCASGVAKPAWRNNWCRECLMLVEWTPEEQTEFLMQGFLTESETDRAGMAVVAGLRRQDDPRRGWTDLMDRMRGGIPESFPTELANWLRQALDHVDRGGMKPGYWPEEAPRWTDDAAGSMQEA